MNFEWWFSILLSIPIGIATGLATPWVQRRLQERGAEKADAEARRLTLSYAEALFYKNNPDLFTQHLVSVAIKTAFIGAAVGILTGLIFAANETLTFMLAKAGGARWQDWEMLPAAGWAVGQLGSVVGSLMVSVYRLDVREQRTYK